MSGQARTMRGATAAAPVLGLAACTNPYDPAQRAPGYGPPGPGVYVPPPSGS